MKKDEMLAVLKQLKFLPTSLINLIYINIAGSMNVEGISTFTLADVERTLNGQNELISCKILFKYEHEGSGKISFKMTFKDSLLKSFTWTC